MAKDDNDIIKLINDNPDYNFSGNLDWELLRKIIIEAENFIRTASEDRVFQQKAFHSLVEIVQNSYHYHKKDTPIQLKIKKKDKKLYILSKNGLLSEEMKSLNYLVEIINSLNYDELKAIQMEQLQTGKIEPKFKKYNGMMSVRKATNNQLICHFSKDEKHGFMVEIVATIDI